MGILGTFRKNMNLKEASMIYKLSFEHIMSHSVFKCVFESILLYPHCLNACLLRKFGYQGFRNELKRLV